MEVNIRKLQASPSAARRLRCSPESCIYRRSNDLLTSIPATTCWYEPQGFSERCLPLSIAFHIRADPPLDVNRFGSSPLTGGPDFASQHNPQAGDDSIGSVKRGKTVRLVITGDCGADLKDH